MTKKLLKKVNSLKKVLIKVNSLKKSTQKALNRFTSYLVLFFSDFYIFEWFHIFFVLFCVNPFLEYFFCTFWRYSLCIYSYFLKKTFGHSEPTSTPMKKKTLRQGSSLLKKGLNGPFNILKINLQFFSNILQN